MSPYKRFSAILIASLLAFSLVACSTQPRKAAPTSPNQQEDDFSATEGDTFSLQEIDPYFYLGETVFIGDSRTNGLLGYEYLPPEQVFAVDGSTQKTILEHKFEDFANDGIKRPLKDVVAQRQPHRLLIAFGVNAIPVMTESEFIESYDILLEELKEASPDSKIVIQAIFPVSFWKQDSIPTLTNDNINQYNKLLKKYCKENDYTFFDISDHFRDEDGGLDYQYDAGDGLHFNRHFYETYLKLLVSRHP